MSLNISLPVRNTGATVHAFVNQHGANIDTSVAIEIGTTARYSAPIPDGVTDNGAYEVTFYEMSGTTRLQTLGVGTLHIIGGIEVTETEYAHSKHIHPFI